MLLKTFYPLHIDLISIHSYLDLRNSIGLLRDQANVLTESVDFLQQTVDRLQNEVDE